MHKKVFDNPEGYLFKMGSGELAVALKSISRDWHGSKDFRCTLVTEKCLKDGSSERYEYENCVTGYIDDWSYKTLELYEKEEYEEKDSNNLKIVAYKNCGSIDKSIITMLEHKEIEWDFEMDCGKVN